MYFKKTAIVALAFLVLPAAALAQDGSDNNPSIQDESEIGTKAEMEKGGDPVTKKYDNNLDYGGFKSSPILIDPKNESAQRQRIYPELSALPNSLGAMAAYSTADDGSGVAAQRTDLSVDDEINKANKAVFQFKGDIDIWFQKDTRARDRYLDIYTRERGIAQLTLSYLDKTVAAGLATVQQQADNDVSHAILQQISWNEDKLANPQRAHMYDDIDEKFERCMSAYFNGRSSVNPDTLNGQPAILTDVPISWRNVDYYDIAFSVAGATAAQSKVCLERVGDSDVSPYHFCTCVASMSRNANYSTWDSTMTRTETGPVWSLVDRAFKGFRTPKGSMEVPASADLTPDDDKWWTDAPIYGKQQVVQFAENFRAMYGDIVMYRGRNGRIPIPTTDGTGGNSGTFIDDADQEMRIRYLPPQMSVPNWITALRDRQVPGLGDTKLQTCQQCPLPGNDAALPGAGTVTRNTLLYCPITGGMVKHGICPSLRALVLLAQHNQIESWRTQPTNSNEFNALNDFWIEASLGAVINAKNIMDIRSMADLSTFIGPLANLTTGDLDYNPTGINDFGGVQGDDTRYLDLNPRLRRFVESYCDASAINAFKKLHVRMMSIAADHLLLNRKISQADREQVMTLMNRVTLYLDLGNEDASQPTDRMLMALGNEADRRDAAETTASAAAFLASIDNQTKEDSIHIFGGNMTQSLPLTP